MYKLCKFWHRLVGNALYEFGTRDCSSKSQERKDSCEHNYINLRVSWMTYSYRDKFFTIFLAPITEMLQYFASQIFNYISSLDIRTFIYFTFYSLQFNDKSARDMFCEICLAWSNDHYSASGLPRWQCYPSIWLSKVPFLRGAKQNNFYS